MKGTDVRFGQLLAILLMFASVITSTIDRGGSVDAKSQYSIASTTSAPSGTDVEVNKGQHKKNKKHKKRGGKPWANEGTVTLRYFGVDRFADAFEGVVGDLNYMSQYMPAAPEFVFSDETYRSCRDMVNKRKTAQWGIMACTFDQTDTFLWSEFAPAGCKVCATSGLVGRTPLSEKKRPDKWIAHMFMEDTDAGDITPALANSCDNERCKGVWEIRFGLVQHEIAHAVFESADELPGSGSSTTTEPGTKPVGSFEFAKAEDLWGESTYPYCTMYPQGYGCMQ